MILALVTPTVTRAAQSVATISVAPEHGVLNASFTATYQVSPCQLPPGTEIRFSWNGMPPDGEMLGSALTDNRCKAILTATPPLGSTKGSHVVFGFAPLPQDGMPVAGTLTSANYRVDPYTDVLSRGYSGKDFGPPPYLTMFSSHVSLWLVVVPLLLLALVINRAYQPWRRRASASKSRESNVRAPARLMALRSAVIVAVVLVLGAGGLLLLNVASDDGTVSGHVYSCGTAGGVDVACDPGQPIAHIGLLFETLDGRHSFLTQTDSSGAYSIRISPGQYRVKSPGGGSATYWPVSPISVLPRQHVVLNLTSHYLAQ